MDFSQTWTTKEPFESPFREDNKAWDLNEVERGTKGKVTEKPLSKDIMLFLKTVDLHEIMATIQSNEGTTLPSFIGTPYQDDDSYETESCEEDSWYRDDSYEIESCEEDSWYRDNYSYDENYDEYDDDEDDDKAYFADDDKTYDHFSETATTISELTFDEEDLDIEWMLSNLLFEKESDDILSEPASNDESDDNSSSQLSSHHDNGSDDESINDMTPTVSASYSSFYKNTTCDLRLAVIFRKILPFLFLLLEGQEKLYDSIEEWSVRMFPADDHVRFRIDMKDQYHATMTFYDEELCQAIHEVFELAKHPEPVTVSGQEIMASLARLMS